MGLLLTIATPLVLAFFAILMERCESASTTFRGRTTERSGAAASTQSGSAQSNINPPAARQPAARQPAQR